MSQSNLSRFRYLVFTIFLTCSLLIVSHGLAKTAPTVTVREEVLTLPWYTSEPYYKMEPPSL